MKLLPLKKNKKDSTHTPNTLARYLFASYPQYRVEQLRPQNCKHDVIVPELLAIVEQSNGLFKLEELGKSLEGRSINLVSCSNGRTRVLLWSQMHGDETTATLALMDIFNFLVKRIDEEKWIREMLEETSLYFILMLNPDGAERVQRRTVQNIDMNRDAKVLATPEARILRSVQQKLKPQFGFNLHDQEPATVGETNEVAAISLLAPALDTKKSAPMVRTRAMRVAALIARVLSQFIPKNIGCYPDDYEPRAFGDNFQSWGTSTVLIESGHAMSDPEKDFIRRLNFVGILAALRCIGNGSYQDAELDLYSGLGENRKNVFDIIIRNVLLLHESCLHAEVPARPVEDSTRRAGERFGTQAWSHSVDVGLAINRQLAYNSSSTIVTIKDIGDLSTFVGLETIDAHKRRLNSSFIVLEQNIPLATMLDELQIHRG